LEVVAVKEREEELGYFFGMFETIEQATFFLVLFILTAILFLIALLRSEHNKQKRLNRCPTCKKWVAKNAISCPKCGHSFGVPEVTLDPPKRKSHLIKLVVILVTLCLFGTILGIMF